MATPAIARAVSTETHVIMDVCPDGSEPGCSHRAVAGDVLPEGHKRYVWSRFEDENTSHEQYLQNCAVISLKSYLQSLTPTPLPTMHEHLHGTTL